MRFGALRHLACWLATIVLALTAVAGESVAEQRAISTAANHERTNRVQPNHGAQTGIGPKNEVKSHQEQARKCTRQSIILARQMLVHELEHMNNFNSMWFSDLDRDELIEGQKHSLSNIVMSGYGTRLLHPDGQPLIEIESSYFRQEAQATHGSNGYNGQQHNLPNANNKQQGQPLSLRLVRRHHDRCSLGPDGAQFSLTFGLAVGPIEHHLDVLYNLPKDLSLGQPLDWRHGQITIRVARMLYEVTLKQMAHYKLNARTPFNSNCPLDVDELLYLAAGQYNSSVGAIQPLAGQQQQWAANRAQLSISSSGLASNNQTIAQVERLFDDYTRPIISRRLRQMLRFYLNSKTLPLSAVCGEDAC